LFMMKATLFYTLLAGLFIVSNADAAPMTDLSVTSGNFTAGGTIPKRFTCDGRDDNPNIRISGVPERTESLALIMDDRDGPHGTFTHWLVWNIPKGTTDFTTGTTPNGVMQGTNDFGKSGYAGPCPPSGEHRYRFHLYALDTNLKLPAGAHRREVDAAIKGHILGQATLTGTYGREPLAK
jgi:Raf kinase inhibitor-like YbhB/YbcL family protein